MSIDGRGAHILVLNSSQGFLELMRLLLSDEGYRVTTDDKTHESADTIAGIAPDLVILDFLWINDDSGWRLLQLLKLDPRTRHIPVILCTAGVQEAEALMPQLRAMQVAVVYKPFDLEMLLAAVQVQLGSRA